MGSLGHVEQLSRAFRGSVLEGWKAYMDDKGVCYLTAPDGRLFRGQWWDLYAVMMDDSMKIRLWKAEDPGSGVDRYMARFPVNWTQDRIERWFRIKGVDPTAFDHTPHDDRDCSGQYFSNGLDVELRRRWLVGTIMICQDI